MLLPERLDGSFAFTCALGGNRLATGLHSAAGLVC
jgi:hypothetical protein